jgi:hypothetical protein
MSHAFQSVLQSKKMLANLDAWLRKAEAHAKAKNFDVNTLLTARLAPDMYPLVRQVQSACDGAKFTAARLSGKDAPKHPDTEQTFDELHARIASVSEWLSGFKEADFDGADARMVKLSWLEGKGVLGKDYQQELATPNFYFHVVTAYAILRHNGVDVGKNDFLGSLTLKDL